MHFGFDTDFNVILLPTYKNMYSFLFSSSHKNMHFIILKSLFSLMRRDPLSTNNIVITFSSLLLSYFTNFTLKSVSNPMCIFFGEYMGYS